MNLDPNHLEVELFDSPSDAPNYCGSKYRPANLTTAVIVGRGTEDNNPTIDFIFKDEAGQKYVALITAGLIESLIGAIQGMKERTKTNGK